jgi:large subunit ribosomal protein L19
MSFLTSFEKKQQKEEIPPIRAGDKVQVYQKNLAKKGGRAQIFEGMVIACKHGKGISGTITVRREVEGVGVERIFPLHAPTIEKIEVIQSFQTRRAKLYYLRTAKGRRARLKRIPTRSTKISNPKADDKTQVAQ